MRRFLRQAVVVWLTVLVLAVTAFVPHGGIHASGAISVADAIANNEGAATVEGYIVGTTNSTSSFSTGQFDAPFSVRTNLLLADDPAEREKANLLPVQLPNTAIRGQLNLADNPGNLGKKVRISGDLGAYFSVPGLRNASSFTWAEGSDEPLQPVTITEARASIGSRVITEGVVNVDNGVLHPGKLSVYMQDGEAGIQLFSHNPDSYPEVKKGDRVRVEGSVSQYNGVTQVLVDELEVLAQNQAVETKTVTIEQYRDASAAEALEGQLVTLEGFVRNVPDYFNGGANLTVINEEFDPLVLRVWESTGIDLTLLKANHWYQVTGISSEYRGTYQVLPREQSDLTLSEVQKEKPSTDGREYVAEVERVVDGDTIRLKEPVLGSTNVRYLNIDTPETYHRVDNELDQNQMDHGKRATEYLQTLLSPGDTVTLKLGEEPLDSYDRLLAEVVREDGLNTNLKMVEEGYAVTYFIWPFKNEEVERYGNALKEAKDAGKGIWNPDDPLLELPFVFRARDRGDALYRPVGDYRSKFYVSADQWESVPDEWRVFFNTEADAEQAGYTPQGQSRSEKVQQMQAMLARYHQDGEVNWGLFQRLDRTFDRLIALETDRQQAEEEGRTRLVQKREHQWEKAFSRAQHLLERGHEQGRMTASAYDAFIAVMHLLETKADKSQPAA
jgi:endonuclease YncB( thermonuclease family)